jgi:cation diffusion facilitator family transporter
MARRLVPTLETGTTRRRACAHAPVHRPGHARAGAWAVSEAVATESGPAMGAAPEKAEANRIEQRTLKISIWGVVVVAVGSVAWGLYLESDVVILNGVFSVLSLVAGGLSLLAAKLVIRPEDKRFPYGYSHVEPLVHTVNGFLVLVICVYSLLMGIEGVRHGGHEVDAEGVVWFGLVSAAICLGYWLYGLWVARRIGSRLVRNDAREWGMDFGFSLVTLAGFAILPFLSEPWHGAWARYADPVMMAVLALLLLPMPVAVLRESLREVLLMATPNDALMQRLDAVTRAIGGEPGVQRVIHHAVKSGRIYFIEVDIVVGEGFALQTVAQQDTLRARIWQVLQVSDDDAWLSVCVTTDPRWV